MSAKITKKATPQDASGEIRSFEPRIIAYLCSWCSYTGADTAGIARLPSPPNIRAIRVPCSGRVSPELIMRTFNEGADGVLVLGCHIGECHYDSGNHRAAKRLPVVQSLMAFAGLEPERLRLDWVSASEGERFARITGEFTESVRALGPTRWRVHSNAWENFTRLAEPTRFSSPPDARQAPQRSADYYQGLTQAIQGTARQLLTSGKVSCVIGYESGTHERARPTFIYKPEQTRRLVWNPDCTHNLTLYLRQKLHKGNGHKSDQKPVAVVVKPCDSRAINVLLSENQFSRDQVHLIGVVCDGISKTHNSPELQSRCQTCEDLTPLVYDTLIGEAPKERLKGAAWQTEALDQLQGMRPLERAEYWLSQFDRCIRCYACRQACPMCDCPTCLFERDDSTWNGLGLGLNEKRTFHLGRAYHLAARCIGCNECERVCPMEIPISLLNMHLAREVQAAFGHQAGLAITPSPFVTRISETGILEREEA